MGFRVKDSNDFLMNVRKSGYNQSMFADELGITPTYLSAITHKRRDAGYALATLISNKLNADRDDFFIFVDKSVAKRITERKMSVAKS